MGFVLGVIATKGTAHLTDFTDAALKDPAIREFQKKVSMRLDDEVNEAYPKIWIGKVEVTLNDGKPWFFFPPFRMSIVNRRARSLFLIESWAGRKLHKKVPTPKGDPGNTLSRDEIRTKAKRLLGYARDNGGYKMDDARADAVLDRLFRLRDEPNVNGLLSS
jgi:2-methylcitrate dehydratase PrpD